MQHIGQLGIGGFREVDGVTPHVVVDEAVAVFDALQHHVLRAALAQLQDHLAHRGLVHVGTLPLAAQDDGRLGEVGREDVGAVGQRPHGFHELWRVGGVHLAVIGHDRIHYAQGLRVGLPHLLDDIDLFGGTEEPGIHRVQFHANTCPGSQIIAQDIGGIVHVPAGEGGVAGEQARGHGAHVAAGGGQHRDGHAQRALAVAAQVVDGGHAGDVGVFAFVEVRHKVPFEIGRPRGPARGVR